MKNNNNYNSKKYQNQKGGKSGPIALTLIILLIAGIAGISIYNGVKENKKPNNPSVDNNPSTSVVKPGTSDNVPSVSAGSDSVEDSVTSSAALKVRHLSTATEGSNVIKTFSYSIVPAEATNQAITAEAKYVDGTSCADVVDVSVNANAKTIAVTCKGAFDKVINVKLTSTDNPSATATITLNYVQKILSMTASSYEYEYYGDCIEYTPSAISYDNYFSATFSKYTKAQNFTYQIDSMTVNLENNFIGFDTRDCNQAFEEYLCGRIEEAFQNQTVITFDAKTIWNLSNSNAYHTSLKNGSRYASETSYDNDCGLEFSITVNLSCVENPEVKCTYNGGIELNFQGTFADDSLFPPVRVQSLNTGSTTNIDF